MTEEKREDWEEEWRKVYPWFFEVLEEYNQGDGIGVLHQIIEQTQEAAEERGGKKWAEKYLELTKVSEKMFVTIRSEERQRLKKIVEEVIEEMKEKEEENVKQGYNMLWNEGMVLDFTKQKILNRLE